ncbi:MAG: hypothetical protein IKR88_02520 [Bacteroidales bacterium]|nr:hypothetical protein [Bacteroidales bacterium]
MVFRHVIRLASKGIFQDCFNEVIRGKIHGCFLDLLSYTLVGNRSEDHFYEHVMYEENSEEMEFPNFRNAIDNCNQK